VADAATARSNLGLGTAATHPVGDLLQTANNLSDVTPATARSNLGLGTVATHPVGDLLQTANNLSDLQSASTARSNLGLGTAATHPLTDFVQPTNNLSDVQNAGTARANIGANVYDIALSIEGKTTNAELVFNFVVGRAFTWPANLTGSAAKASVAATASATFSITQNGGAIGSFNFAASATVATFTFASPVTFAAGDLIQITAPATADTTLANIGVTFAGTR
jgi:hypothetical protein